MAHSSHYPHHNPHDDRAEGVDGGIYLIVAGLLLLVAAFVFSAVSRDENAGTHGGLTLTQLER